MLAFARRRAPKAAFIEGDAQDLPFDAAEFDIVVSNLGVCHVPDQPRTLAEARRVLRAGGKFAMTVWCGPDTSPCFAAVYGAIKTHGHPDVSAPLRPGFHQFSRREVAEKLLSDAGFSNIDVTTVDCVWISMHQKTFSRSMRKGQSVRQRCLTASRRRILLLSALRWRHPYARSFQMEIAGVSLFPRHWFERPLRVVCRQFRGDVRFTPESGHVRCTSRCPLSANSGHPAARS